MARWINARFSVDITPKTPELLLQSSFPSRVQKENIHGVFSKNAANVEVDGNGAITCDGTYGRLIGFDSTGTEVARVDLTLIDASDCGQDRVTFGAKGKLDTPKGIRSFTIEPPQPWDFSVNGVSGGHATAYYALTHDPPEHVEIKYADGTQTVPEGADGTGWAPQVLPDDVSTPDITNAAGKPTLLPSGKLWPDSLIMDVGVDSLGTRAGNRAVSIRIHPIDAGGADIDAEYGHIHAGALGFTKSAGRLNHPTITTDASGHSKVVFRPSSISGPVVIIATSANADSVVDTIRVGIPGLVQLTATTSNDVVGEKPIHPNAWWVTPAMAAKLKLFADTFHIKTDSLAHFNDGSLRYGGKLDIRQQWSTPDPSCKFKPKIKPEIVLPDGCRQRHRVGLDVDFRIIGFTDQKYYDEAVRIWTRVSGKAPLEEADHLHFSYRP